MPAWRSLDQSQVLAKAAGGALLAIQAELARILCMRVAGDVVRASAARWAGLTSWAELLRGGVRVAGRASMPAWRSLDQSQVLAKAAGRALLAIQAELARILCMRVAGDVVRALAACWAGLTSWAELLRGGMRVAGRASMPARRSLDQSQVLAKAAGRALLAIQAELARILCMR